MNLYRYSRDNPISFSDPGGTESKKAGEFKPGTANYDVGTRTDQELHKYLKSKSSEERASFRDQTSGAFRERVNAFVSKYEMGMSYEFEGDLIIGERPFIPDESEQTISLKESKPLEQDGERLYSEDRVELGVAVPFFGGIRLQFGKITPLEGGQDFSFYQFEIAENSAGVYLNLGLVSEVTNELGDDPDDGKGMPSTSLEISSRAKLGSLKLGVTAEAVTKGEGDNVSTVFSLEGRAPVGILGLGGKLSSDNKSKVDVSAGVLSFSLTGDGSGDGITPGIDVSAEFSLGVIQWGGKRVVKSRKTSEAN